MNNFLDKHYNELKKVAPECAVLLNSDGSLPLKKGAKIALYGNGARNTVKGGTGSGGVTSRKFNTCEQALISAGFEITTQNWLDLYDQIKKEYFQKECDRIVKESEKGNVDFIFHALLSLKSMEPDYNLPLDGDGDTAIYVLTRVSGEGVDRKAKKGDFYLLI